MTDDFQKGRMSEWGEWQQGEPLTGLTTEERIGGDFLRSVAPLCETCGGKGRAMAPGSITEDGEPREIPCPTCHGSGFACSPTEVAERLRKLIRPYGRIVGLSIPTPEPTDHLRGSG